MWYGGVNHKIFLFLLLLQFCIFVLSSQLLYMNFSLYPLFLRPFDEFVDNLIIMLLLYIDLRPRQTCHSKDGESAYSIGVGELGWQYGTGLKSHGTNWCTGRRWPVNCMTLISLDDHQTCHSKDMSGRLNYYITRWKQEVS